MKRNTLQFNSGAFQALLTIPGCLFLLVVTACGPAPTPLPLPTYTLLPTYTPYPTITPLRIVAVVPSATAVPSSTHTVLAPSPTRLPSRSPSPSRTLSCIPWTDAHSHIDEMTCVRGKVVSTYKSGNTFFIDFDYSRTSFYSVSFEHTWDALKNQCVEISGKIASYRGRPQIVIERKDQLNLCR